jgi:mannan endo-1,4-beta-mannosidase
MTKRFSTYLFLLFYAQVAFSQQSKFVSVKNSKFFNNEKPYLYIGANYWYGGLLGLTADGKIRLKKELDFLNKHGVNNLRVMAVAEGEGNINGVGRVQPAFQPQKAVYKNEILVGLDYLLSEMGKRKMKAVLYLSNTWEWTGGFLQYLNWNGLIPDSILRRKLTWDEQRDYTSKFYSCNECVEEERTTVKKVVGRTNSITHKKYSDDPTIMSWELANEPRPMRPAALPDFKKWITSNAALIKSLDKNHLVTTGAEGDIGTENMETFSAIHQLKNIDYATIHIWPKNWRWFNDTSMAKSMDTILTNTNDFIKRHVAVMQKISKPLVIEEFGLPRDEQSFYLNATTNSRDEFYTKIFSEFLESARSNGVINGVNFWGFGGMGRPSHKQLLWVKGEDLLADPPMEEQGLNTVFDTDKSTWNIIDNYIKKLK